MFNKTSVDDEDVGEEDAGETEMADADIEMAEIGKLVPKESLVIRKLRLNKVDVTVSQKVFSGIYIGEQDSS